MSAVTKSEHSAFFEKRKTKYELLHEKYKQKLAAFQTLITQVAPVDQFNPTIDANHLPASEGYHFNSATSEWETKKVRNDHEYAAANELFALFTQQAELENNQAQLNEFNQSLLGEVNGILVRNKLRSPHLTLETANQVLLEALQHLARDLNITDNKITVTQAEVAIEVMDIITDALNAHFGNNKPENSKTTLTTEEIINKLTALGEKLELQENTLLLKIIAVIGVGILIFSVVLASIIILQAILVPSTLVAAASSSQIVSFLAIPCISGLSAASVVMATCETSESLDSNPTVAKAILDVAHNWDLEPTQMTTPSITG